MAAIKVQVEKRTGLGKNKVDKLRQKDIIPGVVYSKGEENKNIQIDKGSFEKVYKTAGTSTLIDLDLEGKVEPVLIKEVQMHPFKNQYLHVDFQKLNMNETVKLTIPIVLTGREYIQAQPSILMQQLDEIEIECLPQDIPETIEVDVSGIDFNTPIHVSDLDIFNDENITVLREADELVANLVSPAEEEEEEELEEEAIDAEEVPVVGEEEEESEE
ncbi:50S ribosomal protein L25 [Schnuerera sp. xch1]|uniref:50S ribosomal protein L25 n=1 Tax=Schnuerera sp. xch1 TaxID=2874283 RepID=UPI001CBD6284|nr:50S ribosomal protein L25 [Schnuerera sp. xch1]MBZ2175041.1 50S ribosomal protein L25 [Schnuerera sp. xch1]